MKSTKPLKRNQNLVWLSRDHHSGLLLVWKIRQGLAKGIALRDIAAYLQFFWQHALQGHFADEERLLFATMPEEDGKRCLAEAQHQYLRTLILHITDSSEFPCDGIFTEFADALERHIRFEERTLFPYLEQKLGEERLNAIGWELERSHAVKYKDDWPNEFWKEELAKS